MPTVSKKQERFMQAVAHNPKFAKKVGVPTSVGKEFTKSGGGMKKSSNVKKMAMGGRSLPPNPRRPLAQAIDMPRRPSNPGPMPRPLPLRTGKMAAGGMPPRDIGTGAGPRRPLAQATDMPRPRPFPVRSGKMAAGGTPNDYIKEMAGSITAGSTGGGGRRPLAQAIDRPRVQRDKGYGDEGPRFFQGQAVSASAPRRPLPQAINKPGMGGMPPRDIGTGAGPRTPISLPKPIPGNYMKKGGVATSKMGSVRTASPSRDGIASKGKTKGAMVKMGGVRAAVKGGKC